MRPSSQPCRADPPSPQTCPSGNSSLLTLSHRTPRGTGRLQALQAWQQVEFQTSTLKLRNSPPTIFLLASKILPCIDVESSFKNVAPCSPLEDNSEIS